MSSKRKKRSGGIIQTDGAVRSKRNDQLNITPIPLKPQLKYETRIVGGTAVDYPPIKYPFMASLQRYGSHRCGAILIHEEFMLTAAHCIVNSPLHDKTVELGLHQHPNYGSGTEGSERYSINQYIIHPNYIPDDFDNDIASTFDIALLQLTEPVVGFEPIPLISNSEYDDDGRIGTVMGWGSDAGFGQGGTEVLMEATLVVDDSCGLYGDMITPDHLCAGPLSDTDSAGHCAGDSGGPLIVDTGDENYEVMGIVSWTGGNCQNGWDYPAVYARVDGVQDWINDTIANPPDRPLHVCDHVADFPEIFNLEYNYCYPDSMTNDVFSFNDLYSGTSGEGPALLLDLSTSWCPPCWDAIRNLLDPLHAEFGDDLMIATSLTDVDEPKSCEDWGEQGNYEHNIFDGGMSLGGDIYYNWMIQAGGSGYPTYLIIDKFGYVILVDHGFTNISTAIDELNPIVYPNDLTTSLCYECPSWDECGICNGLGPDFECWDGSYECNEDACPWNPGGNVTDFCMDDLIEDTGIPISCAWALNVLDPCQILNEDGFSQCCDNIMWEADIDEECPFSCGLCVDCLVGDINGDGGWNVMDLQKLVPIVQNYQNTGDDCNQGLATAQECCAADVNGDGGWTILDIVALINCILAENCCSTLNPYAFNHGFCDDSERSYSPPPGMSREEQKGILHDILNAEMDMHLPDVINDLMGM